MMNKVDNVSYELMHMNRKVFVIANKKRTLMRFRDLIKILNTHNWKLEKDGKTIKDRFGIESGLRVEEADGWNLF